MKSDSEIERDFRDELKWDPGLNADDIAVSVKNGVVTLAGFTPSYTDRLEAEAAAKRVAGVHAVANDIEVQADAAIYSTERTLKEAGTNIPADLRKQVEQAVAEAKQNLTAENAQSIRQATERLQQAASKIGEALSRAASQGADGASGQARSSGERSGPSGDDVVDAEFEEVDPRDRKAS